jgi:hypothetical protein
VTEAALWAVAYAEARGVSLVVASEWAGVSNQRAADLRQKALRIPALRALIDEKVEALSLAFDLSPDGKIRGRDGRRYPPTKPSERQLAQFDSLAFWLCEIEGKSYRAAARELKCSPSTVLEACRRHRRRHAPVVERRLSLSAKKIVQMISPLPRGGDDLYVIEDAHGDLKIGRSYDPVGRLRAMQVAHAEPLHLLLVIPGCGGWEGPLHELLAPEQKNGDWFPARQRTKKALLLLGQAA